MSDKQETQQLVVMLDNVFVFSEQLFSFCWFFLLQGSQGVSEYQIYKDELCLSSSTEVYTRDDVN